MAEKRVFTSLDEKPSLKLLKEKIELSFQRLEEIKLELNQASMEAQEKAYAKKRELERKMDDLRQEIKLLLRVWSIESRLAIG